MKKRSINPLFDISLVIIAFIAIAVCVCSFVKCKDAVKSLTEIELSQTPNTPIY